MESFRKQPTEGQGSRREESQNPMLEGLVPLQTSWRNSSKPTLSAFPLQGEKGAAGSPGLLGLLGQKMGVNELCMLGSVSRPGVHPHPHSQPCAFTWGSIQGVPPVWGKQQDGTQADSVWGGRFYMGSPDWPKNAQIQRPIAITSCDLFAPTLYSVLHST